MKTNRFELVRILDKMKNIVQKNDENPALSGVLVENGYLTAANYEITMKVKLEASEGESFILPMKALDLIKNLPEGEVEITETGNYTVIIRTENIKNQYVSCPAEKFIYAKNEICDSSTNIKLPGKKLMEGLSHILFAASDNASSNKLMEGINFQINNGRLNLVALDGHVIALDMLYPVEGIPLNITVPKTAIKRLIGMGIIDDVDLYVDKNCALFKTDEYSIYTRLLDGKYFGYEKIFQNTPPIRTTVDRRDVINALVRAKSCTDEKKPVKVDICNGEMKISVNDNLTLYNETLYLQTDTRKTLSIGFDSKLLLDTIKSFDSENIVINFDSSVTPILVEDEQSDFKALVLPVKLR